MGSWSSKWWVEVSEKLWWLVHGSTGFKPKPVWFARHSVFLMPGTSASTFQNWPSRNSLTYLVWLYVLPYTGEEEMLHREAKKNFDRPCWVFCPSLLLLDQTLLCPILFLPGYPCFIKLKHKNRYPGCLFLPWVFGSSFWGLPCHIKLWLSRFVMAFLLLMYCQFIQQTQIRNFRGKVWSFLRKWCILQKSNPDSLCVILKPQLALWVCDQLTCTDPVLRRSYTWFTALLLLFWNS